MITKSLWQRKRKRRRRRYYSFFGLRNHRSSFPCYALKISSLEIYQDKKVSKDTERQLLRQEISSNSGPSLREVELDRINSLLLEQDLTVKVVASDGHCLYRYTYSACGTSVHKGHLSPEVHMRNFAIVYQMTSYLYCTFSFLPYFSARLPCLYEYKCLKPFYSDFDTMCNNEAFDLMTLFTLSISFHSVNIYLPVTPPCHSKFYFLFF